MSSLFPPGHISITHAASDALATAGGAWTLARLLYRHLSGDWGDVDAYDLHANNAALRDGSRVLSVYTLTTGQRVWIITDGNRRSTTVLMPDDQ